MPHLKHIALTGLAINQYRSNLKRPSSVQETWPDLGTDCHHLALDRLKSDIATTF